LRAVNAFAEGTTFGKPLERFIEKVNVDGKGLLKITYVGGPRAMRRSRSATRCATG